jgi:7,8-dihydropterin-6-yl-methyl-4-(beta-D-ribofuranosyl)aminobenzene 5'-phosphate synthase
MLTLTPLDSLAVDVLTDDVSDTYVSKTLFAVSEFANIILAGATVISGEALLCANLGFGLRLVSKIGGVRHTLLFDTGPEGAIFIRNCTNLGIPLGEVEAIAVSHGHWDHMAALPAAIDKIVELGGQVTVHVNPEMFDERGIRLQSGRIVPVAKVPLPAELEKHGASVVNSSDERLLRRNPAGHGLRNGPGRPFVPQRTRGPLAGGPPADGRAYARDPSPRVGTDHL